MNNNNRGNNRRRGRGNNRQQGGQQVNRIDSRARGNAPQLLEKYKKLAHDAHLNGDRVTEEYYLQFADHYFRVIADQRQRQEDARQQRNDGRPQDYDRSAEYGEDYGTEDDTYGETSASSGNGNHDRGNYDRSEPERGNQEREGRDRNDRERGDRDRGDRERGNRERGGNDRQDRGQRFERAPREAQPQAFTEEQGEAEAASEAPEGESSIYEPQANPFVRGTRGLKERKPRRRSRDEDAGVATQDEAQGSFDPAVLPPSISSAKPAEADAEDAGEEKPKRRRTRKAAPPSDDADGKLEAVNG